MKKFLYIAIIGLVIVACGGSDGGGDPPPPPENRPPSTPTLVSPTNNKLCIDNALVFEWNASTDPDGDPVKYQLQIATDNQFTQIAHDFNNLTSTSKSVSLDKGIAYYWKVKAKDDKNAESDFSSTYQFYTEGEGVSNHLPFAPVIVSPSLDATISSGNTTLEWTANDVDNDPLVFDVYLDNNSSNPASIMVAENQVANTFSATLESGKDYYWKVVVKDGKGGQTIGQTWNFKTD